MAETSGQSKETEAVHPCTNGKEANGASSSSRATEETRTIPAPKLKQDILNERNDKRIAMENARAMQENDSKSSHGKNNKGENEKASNVSNMTNSGQTGGSTTQEKKQENKMMIEGERSESIKIASPSQRLLELHKMNYNQFIENYDSKKDGKCSYFEEYVLDCAPEILVETILNCCLPSTIPSIPTSFSKPKDFKNVEAGISKEESSEIYQFVKQYIDNMKEKSKNDVILSKNENDNKDIVHENGSVDDISHGTHGTHATREIDNRGMNWSTNTSQTRIFIRGLNFQTNKDTLRFHFEQFGNVTDATIICEKGTSRSKGYGFITYQSAAQANNACRQRSLTIDGRQCHISLATPKEDANSVNERDYYNENKNQRHGRNDYNGYGSTARGNTRGNSRGNGRGNGRWSFGSRGQGHGGNGRNSQWHGGAARTYQDSAYGTSNRQQMNNYGAYPTVPAVAVNTGNARIQPQYNPQSSQSQPNGGW